MTQEYLSVTGISELLGVPVNTVKAWWRHDKLPEPDVRVGRVYGWSEPTISRWWTKTHVS